MSDPLLTYIVDTEPAPLAAGRSGTLRILVSKGDRELPVKVHAISVAISVGDTSADLTSNTRGIRTPAPPGWSARIDGGIYRATPDGGAAIVDSMQLTLEAIAVLPRIGVTKIDIDEDAEDAEHAPDTRSLTVTLAKFPAKFKLSALTGTKSVESGGSAVLMWTGTDLPGEVTYSLEWIADNLVHTVSVPYIGPKTIVGIDSEPQTGFTLSAYVAGGPPVIRQFNVGVTPRSPAIDVFKGELIGKQIRLQWSVRHADDISIEGQSTSLRKEGSLVLPLDRFRYKLIAKNRNRTSEAAVDLRCTPGRPIGRSERWLALLPQRDASALIGITDKGCFAYDGTTLSPLKTLSTLDVWSFGAAVSADGRRTFIGTSKYDKNYVALLDEQYNQLQTARVWQLGAATFAPGDASIWVAEASMGPPNGYRLRQLTASRLEVTKEHWFPKNITVDRDTLALCVAPSGDRLFFYFTEYSRGYLWVIDPKSGNVSARKENLPGSGSGPSKLVCWEQGDGAVMLVLVPSSGNALLIDGGTLATVKELPYMQVALTATELIGLRYRFDNLSVIDVVDRGSWTTEQTMSVINAGGWRAQLAAAAGAIYAAENISGTIYSQVATSVEPVKLPAKKAAPVEVLRDESTLVVVAAPADDSIAIDVAGEDVAAEAPEGWSVAREGGRFVFTAQQSGERHDVLAFTFRDAGELLGVRTASDQTLLSYRMATSPDPLQAGREGRITLVVSNPVPESPVTVTSISISIAIGSTAADLTNSASISVPAPAGWTARMEGNIYKAWPSTPEAATITNAGVALTLDKIAINDAVGVTKIYIDEEAADAGYAQDTRTVEKSVGKFPKEFTLSPLTADPATIESGGSTVLMWTATDLPGLVTYKLTWVSDGQPKEAVAGASGPKKIENIVGTGSVAFLLHAYFGGAEVTRQFVVTLLPRAPVIDELTGTLVGGKLTIRWRTRYAQHCTISGSSALYEAAGSYGPVVPDRLHYTLRAVNGGRVTRKDVLLGIEKSGEVSIDDLIFEPAISPDGSLLILPRYREAAAAYDGATFQKKQSVGEVAERFAIAFRSDGERFFLGGHTPLSRFAQVIGRDLRVIAKQDLGWVDAAVFAPDGTSIYVVVRAMWVDKAAILTVDPGTLAVKSKMEIESTGQSAYSICISSDGRTLFVLDPSAKLMAIDVRGGTPRVKALGFGDSWRPWIRFSDGPTPRLVAGGFRDRVAILDPSTLDVVRELKYSPCEVTSAELLGGTAADYLTLESIVVFDLEVLAAAQKLDVPEAKGREELYFFRGDSLLTIDPFFDSRRDFAKTTRIRRYRPAASQALPSVTLRARENELAYGVLSGGGTVVVVASSLESVRCSRIDVALTGEVELPEGWRAEVRDGVTSFTPAAGEAIIENDAIAFTFRNVAPSAALDVRVTSSSA